MSERPAVAVPSPTTIVRNDFGKYFDSCGTRGSIVLYDMQKQQWILSDTTEVRRPTLPASTFKIINLLIALETNAIEDENTVIKWVGSTDTTKYGYRPDIYHDMTVKEAFEVSAGWVFIELAKKIGKAKYRKYLSLIEYGNVNLAQPGDDFWNFGPFAISPVNQVEFIRSLYEDNLPFSLRNTEIVKRVMVTDQQDGRTIRSKTGWTKEGNVNLGWWVGYVESAGGVYFFATRLQQDRTNNRADFGNCRKDITLKVLRDLEVIPASAVH